MRAALVGVLLADAGYFALMLAGPFWLSAVGKGLLALSFAPLGYYASSGVNRLIWSLKDTLDEAGKRKLGRLRVAAALFIFLVVAAMLAAFAAWGFPSSLKDPAQNLIVIAAFSGSLLGLAGGVWIRVSEFNLYKRAYSRFQAQ